MCFVGCFGDVGNGDWAVGRIYIDRTSINLATGGLESRNVTRRWWHTENEGPTVYEDLCSDKRRDLGWEAEGQLKISDFGWRLLPSR